MIETLRQWSPNLTAYWNHVGTLQKLLIPVLPPTYSDLISLRCSMGMGFLKSLQLILM